MFFYVQISDFCMTDCLNIYSCLNNFYTVAWIYSCLNIYSWTSWVIATIHNDQEHEEKRHNWRSSLAPYISTLLLHEQFQLYMAGNKIECLMGMQQSAPNAGTPRRIDCWQINNNDYPVNRHSVSVPSGDRDEYLAELLPRNESFVSFSALATKEHTYVPL